MSLYEPGTYVKGDEERVANTSRDAVSLVFNGFQPKSPISAEADQPAEAPAPGSPDETEEQRVKREELEALASAEAKASRPTAPKPVDPLKVTK